MSKFSENEKKIKNLLKRLNDGNENGLIEMNKLIKESIRLYNLKKKEYETKHGKANAPDKKKIQKKINKVKRKIAELNVISEEAKKVVEAKKKVEEAKAAAAVAEKKAKAAAAAAEASAVAAAEAAAAEEAEKKAKENAEKAGKKSPGKKKARGKKKSPGKKKAQGKKKVKKDPKSASPLFDAKKASAMPSEEKEGLLEQNEELRKQLEESETARKKCEELLAKVSSEAAQSEKESVHKSDTSIKKQQKSMEKEKSVEGVGESKRLLFFDLDDTLTTELPLIHNEIALKNSKEGLVFLGVDDSKSIATSEKILDLLHECSTNENVDWFIISRGGNEKRFEMIQDEALKRKKVVEPNYTIFAGAIMGADEARAWKKGDEIKGIIDGIKYGNNPVKYTKMTPGRFMDDTDVEITEVTGKLEGYNVECKHVEGTFKGDIKVNYGKVKKDTYGRSISIDVNGITFEVDSVDPENPLVVDPESGNIIGDLLPSGKVRWWRGDDERVWEGAGDDVVTIIGNQLAQELIDFCMAPDQPLPDQEEGITPEVEQVIEIMGVTKENAEEALKMKDNNVAEAILYLTQQQSDDGTSPQGMLKHGKAGKELSPEEQEVQHVMLESDNKRKKEEREANLKEKRERNEKLSEELARKYEELNYRIREDKSEPNEPPPINTIEDLNDLWSPMTNPLGFHGKGGPPPNTSNNGRNKCWLNAPLYSILQNKYIQNKIIQKFNSEPENEFVKHLHDLITGALWDDKKYIAIIDSFKNMVVPHSETAKVPVPGLFSRDGDLKDEQFRSDFIELKKGGEYYDASVSLIFLKHALKHHLDIDIWYQWTLPGPPVMQHFLGNDRYLDCDKFDDVQRETTLRFWKNCVDRESNDTKLISLVQSYNTNWRDPDTGKPVLGEAGHFRSFIPRRIKGGEMNKDDFNANYDWVRVDGLHGFMREKVGAHQDPQSGFEAYSFYIFLKEKEGDEPGYGPEPGGDESGYGPEPGGDEPGYGPVGDELVGDEPEPEPEEDEEEVNREVLTAMELLRINDPVKAQEQLDQAGGLPQLIQNILGEEASGGGHHHKKSARRSSRKRSLRKRSLRKRSSRRKSKRKSARRSSRKSARRSSRRTSSKRRTSRKSARRSVRGNKRR